jgi:hypothetical protein
LRETLDSKERFRLRATVANGVLSPACQ